MLVSSALLYSYVLVEVFGVDTVVAPCCVPSTSESSFECDEPVGIAGRIVGGNAGWSAARWSGGTCTAAEDVTCRGNKISPVSATSDIPSTATSECASVAARLCPSS
jgi:hypothetical protein